MKLPLCILLYFFFSLVQAQQPYIGQGTNDCSTTANSALGYSCNGANRTCQSYLTFRAQPPYTTIASIATLLSSDPSELAAVNSLTESSPLGTNQLVLVPVTCSCSGSYYQRNSSYVVRDGDGFFIIANQTLQGLSTCQAIGSTTNTSSTEIFPGQTLEIPLRCACPTRNQTDRGINFLLSYLVTWDDTVLSVSSRFGSNLDLTLEANGLSEQSATVFPFTTLLVPLRDPPSSRATVAPPPPPPGTPPPPPVGTSSSPSSSRTWVYVVAGVAGGIAATLVIGAVVFCLCFRGRTKKLEPVEASRSYEDVEKEPAKKPSDEETDGYFMEKLSSIAHSIKVYTFEELVTATDGFGPKRLIKGSMYRGEFKGDVAAVKRINDGVDVSKEIGLLNKINHSRIVRLSGVCFHDGDWYLIYEYLANGALSDWIYSDGKKKVLSWPRRIQIALDVASGLDYLHGFTSPPQVHKDVRSGNVLLDGDFNAKLSGFDQARPASGVDGDGFDMTRHIFGTKGYLAPEYLENGMVSTKIDVFAFGVLLLEMITGKEVGTLCREGGTNGLGDVVNRVLLSPAEEEEREEINIREFLDLSMEGSYSTDIAGSVVKLVGGCLSKNSSNRPGMNEVVRLLSGILTASLSWELSNDTSDNRNLRDNP